MAPFDRRLAFAAFAAFATGTGYACVQTSYFLSSYFFLTGGVQFVPVLAYLSLVAAAVWLGWKRGEDVRHRVMLRGGSGLLCCLIPFWCIVGLNMYPIGYVLAAILVGAIVYAAIHYLRFFLGGVRITLLLLLATIVIINLYFNLSF